MARKPQTFIYKPTLGYWKSVVQFKFMKFFEQQSPKLVTDLKCIFDFWENEIVLPESKIYKADLEEYAPENDYPIELFMRTALSPDLTDINTGIGEPYPDFPSPNNVDENPEDWVFEDQYTAVKKKAYKWILSDNQILEKIDVWTDKFQLSKNDWVYRWVVVKFQTWTENKVADYDSMFGGNDNYFETTYLLCAQNEFERDFPMPLFQCPSWDTGRFSLQEYEEFIRGVVDFQIKLYLNEIKETAKEKGYVFSQGIRDLETTVCWRYYYVIKNWTYLDIARNFWDSQTNLNQFEKEDQIQRFALKIQRRLNRLEKYFT